MLNFAAQVNSINDFVGWNQRNDLVLSPDYQRRQVWSPVAKSFLIDSILKGFPLPQFFIREKILVREMRTMHEVVDGQQRIHAILDFVDGRFTVKAIHNEEYCNKTFLELPEDAQQKFLEFPLCVNVIRSSNDRDIIEVFSRVNTYSVRLNNQELLNALFLGAFRNRIMELSGSYFEYWKRNAIFTTQGMSRMKEVELTAEIAATILRGRLLDGKKGLRDVYRDYDAAFEEYDELATRFKNISEELEVLAQDEFPNMELRRPPLFYSLFMAVYDITYGLGSPLDGRSIDLNSTIDASAAHDVLFELDAALQKDEVYTTKYDEFVRACSSSTDKIPQRTIRHRIMTELLKQCLR